MRTNRSSLLAGISLVAALSIPGILVAPMGCKHGGTSQAEVNAPEKPSIALMQRMWDAWGTLDPERVAPFYAKDPDLVFYDIAPLRYLGWSAYAAGVKGFLATFNAFVPKVREGAMIRVEGNQAIGTAIVHFDLTYQDETKESFDARWTVVWERRGDAWLVIHEHVSAPMSDGPTEGMENQAPQGAPSP